MSLKLGHSGLTTWLGDDDCVPVPRSELAVFVRDLYFSRSHQLNTIDMYWTCPSTCLFPMAEWILAEEENRKQENMVDFEFEFHDITIWKIQCISWQSRRNTVHFACRVLCPYVNWILVAINPHARMSITCFGRTNFESPYVNYIGSLMSITLARAVTLMLRWCLLKGNFIDPYVNYTTPVVQIHVLYRTARA